MDDNRQTKVKPGLGFDIDNYINPLIAKGYRFSYNYLDHGMTKEQAENCVNILLENGIQCELWMRLIYFQDEYGLNVMKMVM